MTLFSINCDRHGKTSTTCKKCTEDSISLADHISLEIVITTAVLSALEQTVCRQCSKCIKMPELSELHNLLNSISDPESRRILREVLDDYLEKIRNEIPN